jgi:cell pole-organizing protein PopZ
MSEGNGISNNPGPASSAEPSMEEILASIRRILTEEENERAAMPRDDADDDVLVLDTPMTTSGADIASATSAPPATQMGGDEPSVTHFTSEPTLDSGSVPGQAEGEQYLPATLVDDATPAYSQVQPAKENNMDDQVQSPEGLVSESAAQEIASKVGSLVRSVSAERAVGIGRPGVTIEDLVREEIKPVLKSWLDSHLPSLVERVVRAEIGRVIDRM